MADKLSQQVSADWIIRTTALRAAHLHPCFSVWLQCFTSVCKHEEELLKWAHVGSEQKLFDNRNGVKLEQNKYVHRCLFVWVWLQSGNSLWIMNETAAVSSIKSPIDTTKHWKPLLCGLHLNLHTQAETQRNTPQGVMSRKKSFITSFSTQCKITFISHFYILNVLEQKNSPSAATARHTDAAEQMNQLTAFEAQSHTHAHIWQTPCKTELEANIPSVTPLGTKSEKLRQTIY